MMGPTRRPAPSFPTLLVESPSVLGYSALDERRGPILPGSPDRGNDRTADRRNGPERSPAPTETVRPGEYDAVLHADSVLGELI